MIKILQNRRSVRSFKNTDIEGEKLDMLKEALLLAPTSRNFEPCEFIFIKDKNILEKLSIAKPHGAGFLKECNVAVVICGDTSKSDVCIEDCSIASITLQYAAEAAGLGSCWAQMRLRPHNDNMTAEEYVRKTLSLPETYTVVSIIGLGYPASKPAPKTKSDLKYQKIHIEKL